MITISSFSASSHAYFLIFRNFEFTATITVLADMNAAPIAGEISIPAPYSTPAAKGIAIAL